MAEIVLIIKKSQDLIFNLKYIKGTYRFGKYFLLIFSALLELRIQTQISTLLLTFCFKYIKYDMRLIIEESKKAIKRF